MSCYQQWLPGDDLAEAHVQSDSDSEREPVEPVGEIAGRLLCCKIRISSSSLVMRL